MDNMAGLLRRVGRKAKNATKTTVRVAGRNKLAVAGGIFGGPFGAAGAIAAKKVARKVKPKRRPAPAPSRPALVARPKQPTRRPQKLRAAAPVAAAGILAKLTSAVANPTAATPVSSAERQDFSPEEEAYGSGGGYDAGADDSGGDDAAPAPESYDEPGSAEEDAAIMEEGPAADDDDDGMQGLDGHAYYAGLEGVGSFAKRQARKGKKVVGKAARAGVNAGKPLIRAGVTSTFGATAANLFDSVTSGQKTAAGAKAAAQTGQVLVTQAPPKEGFLSSRRNQVVAGTWAALVVGALVWSGTSRPRV